MMFVLPYSFLPLLRNHVYKKYMYFALNSMKKIMGERVKLMIREEAPFSSIEKTIEIEEAVDRIFNKESVVLVGNKGID